MTTSIAIPTARERKRRTRTTNVSSQPALRVSKLPIALVQLTHRAEVLACPACQTWCPLTLNKGTKEWKIAPHHTERAGTPGARRCSNSNRLVIIDIPSLVRWQEKRVEASADAAARRPTKVLRKVKAPLPKAIHQLTPAAPTADTARRTYETHRTRCAACTTSKKDGRLRVVHCADGERLAVTYLELLRQEPERRAAQARAEEEQQLAERRQAKEQVKQRAAEWPDARVDFLLAKRRRAQHITGRLVEPIKGAAVPVGARPIGAVRSAEDVLAENPIRKRQQLST
ncbi:hypothetical protein ACIG0C_30170 [Kitasatospora aureofaciens]|uniref:Uncharacterized protein n=1 Tax=Kitasatospora aureofaciens TaxID=1894 RepID=A0A1E7NE99_KITAU|nr:hypothetical protein [Kitasatospora aureofaciens]ARF83222.1 hypothetical protein B6264_30240 [Kitasatospora aureofaciens]OEV38994.1 hypothetical protein HS99_0017970 [Kitasatospora aureofaciens]GGU99373.1 hypothetical protein GCM10010502_62280 [Kitasatospora aureofaciens]